jgi:hypothetical protein
MDPTAMILAVGLAHLGAMVGLWFFGLARRFPWLLVHLGMEGVAQVVDAFAPGAYRDTIWATGQVPRLALRALVVWEVTRESTRHGLDYMERIGLLILAGLAVLLAATVAAFVVLVIQSPPARGAFAEALVARQYVLMAFSAWLVLINGYLLWTRTPADHNLMVYRAFATLGSVVIFVASSFVRGGLGYRFLPFTDGSWWQIHQWQPYYTFLLIAVLALFIRPDEPEIE